MRARAKLWLLVAVLAGVLALLVTAARLGVDRPDERARATRDSERRALAFAPAEVSLVELEAGGQAVVARRAGGGWVARGAAAPGPGGDRTVDGEAVAALLERLSALRVRAAVEPGRDLVVYGLASPRLRVRLVLDAPGPGPSSGAAGGTGGAGARLLTLDVGDDAPVGGAFYARRGGEAVGDVLAIEGSSAGLLAAAEALGGRRD